LQAEIQNKGSVIQTLSRTPAMLQAGYSVEMIAAFFFW
jgi:hypothetical protein